MMDNVIRELVDRLSEGLREDIEACFSGYDGSVQVFDPGKHFKLNAWYEFHQQSTTNIPTLFHILSLIPDLQVLDLSNADLDDRNIAAIANHMPLLSHLGSFSIAKNPITSAGAKDLKSCLSKMNTLKHLDLSYTNLDNIAVDIIGPQLLQMDRLETLNVNGVNLGFAGYEALSRALRRCLTLRSLSVSGTSAEDLGVAWLLGELPNIEELTYLNIGNNFIGADSWPSLSSALGRMRSLMSLILWHSSLGDYGIIQLSESIGQMPRLAEIRLRQNGFGPSGMESLLKHIGNSTQLSILDVSANCVGDYGLDAVMNLLDDGSLPKLTQLCINNNDIRSIPEESLRAYTRKELLALLQIWRETKQAKKQGDYLLEVKGMLLGNGGVGKTVLGKRLAEFCAAKTGEPKYSQIDGDSPSTHAFNQVAMSLDVPLKLKDESEPTPREVEINLYDFGGQVELHGSHRFFMSDRRNFFIILVNPWVPDGQADRRRGDELEIGRTLEYWVRLAHDAGSVEASQVRATHQPVIIVEGHADERPPGGKSWLTDEVFQNLKDIHPNLHLVREYSGVDHTKIRGVDRLVAKLLEVLAEDPLREQLLQGDPKPLRTLRQAIKQHAATEEPGKLPKPGYISRDLKDPSTDWYQQVIQELKANEADQRLYLGWLSTLGHVHFLQRRDSLDESPSRTGYRRHSPQNYKPAVSVAQQAVESVFFDPGSIKTAVYNVLRSSSLQSKSSIGYEDLIKLFKLGGLETSSTHAQSDIDQHHHRLVALMLAKELIYQEDTKPGTPPRYVIPDRMPELPRSECDKRSQSWSNSTCLTVKNRHVLTTVLWRLMSDERFAIETSTPDGSVLQLFRNVVGGVFKSDGAQSVRFFSFVDADRSELFLWFKSEQGDDLSESQRTFIAGKLQSAVSQILSIAEKQISIRHPQRRTSLELVPYVSKYLQQKISEAEFFLEDDAGVRYQIEQVAGSGGFSVVCKAKWSGGDELNSVSLKLVPYVNVDEDAVTRLAYESSVLTGKDVTGSVAPLRGPSSFELDIDFYLVKMKGLTRSWSDGVALAKLLDERRNFDWLKCMKQVCDAVAQLHHNRVWHLDLTPSNILVDAGGTPEIIDFGAMMEACETIHSARGELRPVTQKFVPLAYVNYCNSVKESADKEGPSEKIDVYSLGVILEECKDRAIRKLDQASTGLLEKAITKSTEVSAEHRGTLRELQDAIKQCKYLQ